MNVLDYLDKNLKKHDWSLEEKERYLYLQSCILFSYDPRRQWLMYQKNEKLEKEIWERKIDLTNVTDFNVICTSWSKEVYYSLLSELLGIKADVVGNVHKYVLIQNQNGTIKANASFCNDLARVKMNLSTKQYQKLDESKEDNRIWLRKQDKQIGYIQDLYFDEIIKKIKIELQEETIGLSLEEKKKVYFEKITKLYQSFNFTNYSDASYCVYYLLDHLLEESSNLQEIRLFCNHQNKPWEFVSIYPIMFENKIIYYRLAQEQDKYIVMEANNDDITKDIYDLKGPNKETLRRLTKQ